MSIPAPAIARTSERVSLAAPIADASGDGAPLPLAMVAAALNRDSAGSFPGIELSGDVAQRSADSMELSRNPLEFVSQPPPSVPPAGSSGGLLDPSIDGHHDALALPPSDAPPPPEPPQRSRPNPSMGPAAAGTVGTPVPTLYDDRRPSQRQPPGRTTPVQHATPKAFGLLGGVALFTLALYAIFVW